MAKRNSSFHMGDEFNGSGKKTYLKATQHNIYKPLSQENVRLTPDYKQCISKVVGALPFVMNPVKTGVNSMLKALGAIPSVSHVIVKNDKRTGKFQTSFVVRKVQLTTGAYLHKIPRPLKDWSIKDFTRKSISREKEDYAEDIEVLNRYVSEEIFEAMGWDVEVFETTYGKDVIEKLKEYMYQYGMTNRYSICMFLATIGTESGDGSAVLENRSYFEGLTYRENTRGAGLIQITGLDQKKFLEYLEDEMEKSDCKREDKDLLTEIQEYIKKYKIYTIEINGEEKVVCDNSEDVATFISDHYPVESAIWYWASYEKCTYWDDISIIGSTKSQNIPLNQYVCNIIENADVNDVNSMIAREGEPWENLFMATQYYVLGSPWSYSRLQKIAVCMDDTYEIANNKLTFTLPQGDPKQGTHTANLPRDWMKRADDWKQLTYELFG